MSPEILEQLGPLAFKALVGIIVTGLLGAFMWPFRKMKKEWQGVKESLAAVHEELSVQRSNHLSHIESNGKQQIELLAKMAESMDGVRLDLREQTTILRMSAPKMRVTRKKK
jgi:hypothetical protein